MLDSPLIKRLGVTPAKLVLVAVLAVVLMGVVILQWPESSPPAASAASANSHHRGRGIRQAAHAAASPEETPAAGEVAAPSSPPARPWPKLNLDQALQHNPFLLPADLLPPVETTAPTKPDDAHSQQILQKLTDAESGMVLMVGGEHIARIGATTIRTGDKIGRYRVAKIDATGVWLVDE